MQIRLSDLQELCEFFKMWYQNKKRLIPAPFVKTEKLLGKETLQVSLVGIAAYLTKVKARCFGMYLENKE